MVSCNIVNTLGYYLLRQLIFAIFGESQNLVAAIISARKIYPALQFKQEKKDVLVTFYPFDKVFLLSLVRYFMCYL